MNVKTVWAKGDQESPMAEPEQKQGNSLMRVISGEVWYRVRIMVTSQGRNQKETTKEMV